MNLQSLQIPDKKIKQLESKKLFSLEDIVRFYPRKYEDHRNVSEIANLKDHVGEEVSVIGYVKNVNVEYRKNYVVITLFCKEDLSELRVYWFHQTYLFEQLCDIQREGKEILLYGKVDNKFSYMMMANPKFLSTRPEIDKNSIIPVYGKIRGMSGEYFYERCLIPSVAYYDTAAPEDNLDAELTASLNIISDEELVHKIHMPGSTEDIKLCSKRIAVEKMLPYCYETAKKEYETCFISAIPYIVSHAEKAVKKLKASLPYKLTDDQDNAVKKMQGSLSRGERLNVLLQGDVGCGKTIVAAMMAAITASCNSQVVIMAPTTVLAEQHYEEFKSLFPHLNVIKLFGKMKVSETKDAIKKIKEGDANIVIGTSSVIGANIEYKSLGLAIVDEEHRFGVKQRDMLTDKASRGVNLISMSATPIPRSLALTVLGKSTEIINIKTLPNGRKPVITVLSSKEETVYDGMMREIQKGHQCYVVCPFISKSENEDFADVESVDETETKLNKYFKGKTTTITKENGEQETREVKVATISGKMSQKAIQETIESFKNKEADILLSTTIVEVGVNVPNATVMMIKNAERFGLAQLHQLRGRVGRSSIQSFCVLLSKDTKNDRLIVMTKTNDGFVIAEEDLRLRGTGDLVGTEQSGFQDYVSLIIEHPSLYKKIVAETEKIVRDERRNNWYSVHLGQTQASKET